MKVWLPFVYAGTGSDVFTYTLANELNKRGVETQISCFPHRWQYFPWRMRHTLCPQGTDIIVANSWNAFVFEREGTKLVAVEHLFVLDSAYSPYRRISQSFFHNVFVRSALFKSYKAADAVVALSEYARGKMQSVFPFIDPIVINNGIDINFYTPGSRGIHSEKKHKKRLLFIGNPSARKGADLLPRILSALGPEYELFYTSGLKDKDPFQKVLGMSSLGKLDREGVRAAYRDADIFLFPSRLEGYPLVVIEALSCGTPAVVFNASSLPEIVENGVNGFVAAVDDVNGMVNGIKSILSSREGYGDMSNAARKSAEESFSLDKMADHYLSLFEQLLNRCE